MNHKIILTGGGTAGHVTPNIALIEELKSDGWKIDYIGSQNGVEKDMINAINIPYHEVSSGKLRRYFSLQNMLEPFKILVGVVQAYRLLANLKPDVVFSKGGFVAFPVVVGAWLQRIPVIAHESDMSPGLANRLSFPFVTKICITFAAAKKHVKQQDKVEVTGTPIRKQLFQGNKLKGLSHCGFTNAKPCLLVIGGSQGAHVINDCIRQSLDSLCQQFQIIHLCGKGKVSNQAAKHAYCQFEYAKDELADLYAASDIVVSRAGANSLYEILALNKPHVLIPLSRRASRGDQIQNANYFHKQGISIVVNEEALTQTTLLAAIQNAYTHRKEITHKIKSLHIDSATHRIMAIIKEIVHVKSPETV